MCQKKEILQQLQELRVKSKNIESVEDLENLHNELMRLENKYDISGSYSGRGGIGDDEDIFPLMDYIIIMALAYIERYDVNAEMFGYHTLADYLDELTD